METCQARSQESSVGKFSAFCGGIFWQFITGFPADREETFSGAVGTQGLGNAPCSVMLSLQMHKPQPDVIVRTVFFTYFCCRHVCAGFCLCEARSVVVWARKSRFPVASHMYRIERVCALVGCPRPRGFVAIMIYQGDPPPIKLLNALSQQITTPGGFCQCVFRSDCVHLVSVLDFCP